MKREWKHFLINPWWVTVGGGLILSVILSIINDLIKDEQVFSTISDIFSMFICFLNYKVKVWWLLLGLAIMICLSVLFLKYIGHTVKTPDKPKFLEYTQDTILGYMWRWNWQKNIYGQYDIENLCPVCSRCNTPLVESFSGYREKYKCLRCEMVYSKELPEFAHVKMLISDNVRRKYFPNE